MPSDKERLILGLEKQVLLMTENAKLLEKLLPELSHHYELKGAADITQTWVDGIKKDLV